MAGAEDEVLWMVRGAWVTMCLRATCELGVVDALAEPHTLAELAAETTADPDALARLLNVLGDLDLVDLEGDRYAATARGEVLRTSHPSGIRHLVMMQTAIPSLTAWRHLSEAVRRGEAVYERLHGSTFWEWLAANPEEEAVFNSSMARRGALQVAAIRQALDLSHFRLLVDVGGGKGAMVAGLLDEERGLQAIVADRPDVAAAATATLAAAGLGTRARGEPADFFVEVPSGGDVYVLSNVIHDWDDTESIAVLSTVRRAMGPDAVLLLVENVLDAPGRTPEQQRDLHLVDLHMLVAFGARERSKAEYDGLLTAAGFAPSRLAPSPNSWAVLETRLAE